MWFLWQIIFPAEPSRPRRGLRGVAEFKWGYIQVKLIIWRCIFNFTSFLKKSNSLTEGVIFNSKMKVEFVLKMAVLANIWDGWTKFQNFFTRASWGVWLKMTKKNLVPGLARPAGPGCKVAKVEPSLVENLKMTIFMYVMSKNHNCLRVICMPYGSKKFFWPNWPTLGTPGHPQAPLEVA